MCTDPKSAKNTDGLYFCTFGVFAWNYPLLVKTARKMLIKLKSGEDIQDVYRLGQ